MEFNDASLAVSMTLTPVYVRRCFTTDPSLSQKLTTESLTDEREREWLEAVKFHGGIDVDVAKTNIGSYFDIRTVHLSLPADFKKQEGVSLMLIDL